jgi:hypothetical protein
MEPFAHKYFVNERPGLIIIFVWLSERIIHLFDLSIKAVFAE